MILVRFPPCTGAGSGSRGHDWGKGAHIYRSISTNFDPVFGRSISSQMT